MLELVNSRRLLHVLTALLHIGAASGAVSGRLLAERMVCPRRYLEADLQRLAKAGILESQRGSGGGYSLARNPARISLLDVMQCLGDDGQLAEEGCALLTQVAQPGLQKLAAAFQEALAASTLADWLARAEELGLVRRRNQVSDFMI